MKSSDERAMAETLSRNPFWPCFFVFALLATDYALRFQKLYSQRQQMVQAGMNQAQTIGRMSQALSQQTQAEAKLQALSVDLVKLASTNNTTALQIVREFNIEWTPPQAQAAAKTNSTIHLK